MQIAIIVTLFVIFMSNSKEEVKESRRNQEFSEEVKSEE